MDINGCKLSGLKTHDLHVILQKRLPLVVRNILREDVVIPVIELSRFFNSLCSKELELSELENLSTSIRETLCRLEMIFPPSFFDIMMHLPVHLAEEARLGGPVCYRWIYPVERYLAYRWIYPVERYLHSLKGYVRNKAMPEASIVEGYISEECLTFFSRFFKNITTKLNRPERHESAASSVPPSRLSVFMNIDYSRRGGTLEEVSDVDRLKMRHYI